MNIRKLEIVPLRTAFKYEAPHFTVWLEENISALSERIGLQLNVLEREKSVGSFQVDLLCEDENGNYVIIENQLERTDHDHLGKLLTYLVNLDAKTAIWITPEARPEHQRVIDWLNESTGLDMAFYLVQVEAIRIGDSPFAPLFTILAQPDEQTHEIGEQKKELADRHYKRIEFWQKLLERSQGKTKLFANISPGQNHWLSTGSGKGGVTLNYQILKGGAGIELYIDTGDQNKNKAIFEALRNDQVTIETEFGESLEWHKLEDKRASRIRKLYRNLGSINEPESWNNLQDILIDAMIKFDKAFRRRLQQIEV